MSSFLIDKEFSEHYEKYFADLLMMNWNKTNGDDHGIDIFNDKMKIDIKCYSSPLYVLHFKGVFLETYLPRSNRDGWLLDENKETTHYILLQDCDRNKVEFYEGWLIKKEDLLKALEEATLNDDIEEKRIPTAYGYMLPYEYLDCYCLQKFHGMKFVKENLQNVA
jgi:hypothetical protein